MGNIPRPPQTAHSDCVILYLEDDDATAFLFQKALQEAGAHSRLFRVTDGDAALSFLRREAAYKDAPRPHLIVLDINVPKRSGLEVLAAIQQSETLRPIPAVVFSSSTLPDDRERALALGAHKFFLKSGDWKGFLKAALEVCSILSTN